MSLDYTILRHLFYDPITSLSTTNTLWFQQGDLRYKILQNSGTLNNFLHLKKSPRTCGMTLDDP